MNLLFSLGRGRVPAATLKGVVLGWLVAEVLAFLLAMKLFGFGLTLLLMLGTSLLGLAMLRRIGLEAARQLRRAAMAGGTSGAVFVDGTLTALGALLLILPGFVSDAVGLALATPSLRQALAARVMAPGPAPHGTPRRGPQDVIDLAPEDWRVVDKPGRS